MNYAINVKTKEHRPWDDKFAQHPDWILRLADDEGWITWSPNIKCPMPKDALVEVRHRDGKVYREPCGTFHTTAWHHIYEDGDIMAYRPIFDETPTPKWRGPHDGLPPIGTRCMFKGAKSKNVGEITHHLRNGNAAIIEYDNGAWDCGMRMNFYPLQSPRDEWVEQALEVAKTEHETAADYTEALYDAMIRGELPMPKAEP